MTADVRPDVPQRGLTTLLGLVVPLAIAAAAALLALSWRSELPDPVATHWGRDGVNGVGSLTGQVVVLTLVAVLCTVGGWALAFFVGRASSVRRIGVGTSLGMTTFLSGLLLATLQPQKGLSDAYQAPDAVGAVAAVALVALVVAALGALAVRPDPPRPSTTPVQAPDGLVLPADARVAWVQHVRTVALGWIAVGVGACVVVIGIATDTAVLLVPLGVLIAALLATFASFTVTVDGRGLTARGTFGWPRLVVPLSEIEGVAVTQVRPLRDFGGWGYRVGRQGRVGIVARAGDAVEVRRTGARIVVVTVDDASTGATLLQALAARATAGPVTGE
ncbi:DUF1648 domain-containing protein [Cellulomonas sp. McL0617]|uniref:DUF1648 domain-containing protein n=1 Tax=Cellulomonas sp. McL0617 TaxID=3415675 RepID=UPI003CE76CC7